MEEQGFYCQVWEGCEARILLKTTSWGCAVSFGAWKRLTYLLLQSAVRIGEPQDKAWLGKKSVDNILSSKAAIWFLK